MCIGIPMQVIEAGFGEALCQARDGCHRIDTRLVGDPPPGTWLMVFLGAAREVVSAETAARAADALEALAMVQRGEAGFEHLFADLIGREPQLPDFLQPAAADPRNTEDPERKAG